MRFIRNWPEGLFILLVIFAPMGAAFGFSRDSETPIAPASGRSAMTDDDHDVWLQEVGKLLNAARSDPGTLELAIRQLCKPAFRDFQFSPSVVLDYMVASSPALFEDAGFSDDDIHELMPTFDRIIGKEWAARRPI